MTTASKATREIMERFNSAFEEHRPEDLDDLIGEGCVLENTGPAPDGARYEGREACVPGGGAAAGQPLEVAIGPRDAAVDAQPEEHGGAEGLL